MTLFGDTKGDPLQEGTEVQTAARNMFAGCLPERDEEVKALWAEFDLRFRLAQDSHDGEKIVMRGGLYRYVDFNHRTLRAFWVAGYAAWEGYSVMAESIATGRQGSLARFKELVEAVRRIAGNADSDSEPLPEGVAEPGQSRQEEGARPRPLLKRTKGPPARGIVTPWPRRPIRSWPGRPIRQERAARGLYCPRAHSGFCRTRQILCK